MMSKSSRRWWIGGGLLLVVVLGVFLWPRPIRIPLKDGTTITIAAITVGTKHSRPDRLTWARVWSQITRWQWRWPAQTITMPDPGVMLWFDGKPFEKRGLVLIDRHGWRWYPPSGGGDQYGQHWVFHPIETDGTAQIEVLGHDGVVLGTAVIPVPTAVPVDKVVLVASIPPVYTTPGEPAPLPITRKLGPLEATLVSFDLQSRIANQSPTEGRYQLETRWNGQPFTPQISFVTITDQFGGRDMVVSGRDEPLLIRLSPREAVWDLHFFLFRSLDMPLEADETLLITPVIEAGKAIFQQEGSCRSQPWRVSFSPSGSLSLQPKFDIGAISVGDESPVIVAELDALHSGRIRIEPLDRDVRKLPATPLSNRFFPMNVFGVRCPGFDAAKGHTIRVGFEQPQIVQFTIRPQVTPKEAAK